MHFAVQQKLTQHCQATILQYKLIKKKKSTSKEKDNQQRRKTWIHMRVGEASPGQDTTSYETKRTEVCIQR